MTDTQIVEHNRAIAEFMGLSFDAQKKDGLPFYIETNKDGWISKSYCNPRYHSDWNALMDCWKKLRSTVWQTNDGGYPVEFMLFFERWKRECFNGFIKECHQILYEAIQWYNNTLNKQQ